MGFNKNKIFLTITALLAFILFPQFAVAGENWDVKLDIEGSYGHYSHSVLREDIWSSGLFLSVDYLNRMGFSVGYNRKKVTYKLGIPTLTQHAYFASVRRTFSSDRLSGQLTFRVDSHLIRNNDPSNSSDGGEIVAPQISYFSFDKSFYADLGYTYSNYADDLALQQFSPTLGLGFKENRDWLQVRGYFIFSSDTQRTQGKQSTSAAEIKWTHFFSANAFLSIDKSQLTLLAGERTYAVDADTGAVYNLPDAQKGSVSLGGFWNLDKVWSVLLVGGFEEYNHSILNNRYNSRSVYMDISRKWSFYR